MWHCILFIFKLSKTAAKAKLVDEAYGDVLVGSNLSCFLEAESEIIQQSTTSDNLHFNLDDSTQYILKLAFGFNHSTVENYREKKGKNMGSI